MRRDSVVLGFLAHVFNWIDDFIILVSGPMLGFGLGLAAVDLFTGGRFLEANPGLVTVWAVCQAVGVTGQLLGTSGAVRRAFVARRYATAAFAALLMLILGYVEFLAAQAFTLHEAFNATVSQALAFIGIDATSWAFQRAAVAVGLVMLAGLTRYIPEQESEAEETARLEREARMAPLRGAAMGAKIAAAKGNAALLLPGKKGAPAPVTTPLEVDQTHEETGESADGKVVAFTPRKTPENRRATQWIYSDVVSHMSEAYGMTLTPEKAREVIKAALQRARKKEQYLGGRGGPLWADVRTVKSYLLATYGAPKSADEGREAAD